MDSSVAALLLKNQGHHILGVTFSFFAPCGGVDNSGDAAAVAQVLGITHCQADLAAAFSQGVIAPFVQAYGQGQTPNPCLLCNARVKFGPQALAATGAQGFATGHYAQVELDQGSGRYLLKMGAHRPKDQSYFLAGLSQDQLAVAHFPLGGYSKEEIRALAQEAGLPTAFRSDSQDICFIPDGDYASFICQETGRSYPQGDFVDLEGRVLGRHRGLIHYTVGQRRGLGISSPSRLYVQALRPGENQVVLAEDGALYGTRLLADRLNFVAAAQLEQGIDCLAKIRSRHAGAPARAQQIGPDLLEVVFAQPQRAITPGQGVVLYQGDTVLASGIIH